jgi:threonine synthase
MKIEKIICDHCSLEYKYPLGMSQHFHEELEIGGVPMNIWTPHYKIEENFLFKKPKTKLSKIEDKSINAQLFLKDESTNPTQSFKDRGMPNLIEDVIKSRKKKVAIPSTGNAAISLSYYARKKGIESIVFIPENTPNSKKSLLSKSTIIEDVDLIESFEHFIRECKKDTSIYNGFPVINIPYMMGVREIAYEIYMQLNEKIPDWIIIPVGSGGNIVSQHMGFSDIYKMGLINKMPRFVSVQVSGADPITQGYISGSDEVIILDDIIDSKAEAIASDTSFNYYKIMNILDSSNGIAVSVSDSEIDRVREVPLLSHLEYSSLSVYAAVNKISHYFQPNDNVVMIGTAGGKK